MNIEILKDFFNQFNVNVFHRLDMLVDLKKSASLRDVVLCEHAYACMYPVDFKAILQHLDTLGYTHYISIYSNDTYQYLKIDDGLKQKILPKAVYFISEECFIFYRPTLESFVHNIAVSNIYRHTNERFGTHCIKLPLVSVVVTNYNYEAYLEECLESILNQDYPFIERFIVDDYSNDGSLKIIETYADRFKILKHSHNQGQLKGFFTGLDASEGSFVVYVDADDLLDAHAISASLSVHLLASPPVAFTCLRNRQIGEKSEVLNNYHLDFAVYGQPTLYISPRIIYRPFWRWSTTSAMMFRKSVLDLIAIEETDAFRICADYYLVHFANLIGGSILINIDAIGYRRHGKNNFSKNLVIGGHVPTGHFLIDNHPEHQSLWEHLLKHMWSNKNLFERYFNSYEGFIRRLAYIAPYEIAIDIIDMDRNTQVSYQRYSDESKVRLEQFRIEDINRKKLIAEKMLEKRHEVYTNYELHTFFQL